MKREDRLEQLIGIRAQLRALNAQVTFLIDDLRDEEEYDDAQLPQGTDRPGPVTFGSRNNVREAP